MPIERREFLGLRFDPLSQDDVLERLARVTPTSGFAYVVTPNVDHVVRMHENAETTRALRPLYDEADLCLCDSRILQLLARFRGVTLPVTAGSELTRRVFDGLLNDGDRVAVVGGDSELLAKLQARYPRVEILQHCPPMGLRTNASARRAAAQFVADSKARFTFIAVGSPQQEMIASEAKAMSGASGTALCIGASLEFLTGRVRRAPLLAQRMRLEWAHRLISDPSGMWRRYLLEGPRIFLLAYRWRPARHGLASK